jgi:hypothetical protein
VFGTEKSEEIKLMHPALFLLGFECLLKKVPSFQLIPLPQFRGKGHDAKRQQNQEIYS